MIKQFIFLLAVLSAVLSEKSFAQQTDSIQAGLDMTQFTFQDTTGKNVSLKDFKGKYVLLDVWASWCHPCINEFPRLDSIKNVYKDRNLIVVQISCDREKQRWLNGRFWYKRKDNQWWINGDTTFMQQLQVATIPRYMLIDKRGKLLNAYLPALSDKKTTTILTNLKGL